MTTNYIYTIDTMAQLKDFNPLGKSFKDFGDTVFTVSQGHQSWAYEVHIENWRTDVNRFFYFETWKEVLEFIKKVFIETWDKPVIPKIQESKHSYISCFMSNGYYDWLDIPIEDYKEVDNPGEYFDEDD